MVELKTAEDRKKFMTPQFENPMKKSEDYSVKLRKKKHDDIIKSKRQARAASKMMDFNNQGAMQGCEWDLPWLKEMSMDTFNAMVEEMAPGIKSIESPYEIIDKACSAIT
jgi:hypothetical protein